MTNDTIRVKILEHVDYNIAMSDIPDDFCIMIQYNNNITWQQAGKMLNGFIGLWEKVGDINNYDFSELKEITDQWELLKDAEDISNDNSGCKNCSDKKELDNLRAEKGCNKCDIAFDFPKMENEITELEKEVAQLKATNKKLRKLNKADDQQWKEMLKGGK